MRKRAARKPRRRVARRKGLSSGALTTVNRSLQPFANSYVVKQKYATTVLTDANGQFVFNLNSVFKPEATAAGHQCFGFDQLAGLYNKYRVISCGWRVQLPLNPTNIAYTIGCLPTNDPGIVWANFGEMAENSRAKYITQLAGAKIENLSGKVYLPKLIGKTRAAYMGDDRCAAQVTTSPLEQMLLYVQAFGASFGTPATPLGLQVVLEYTVEYFDAKRLLQS